MNSDFSLLPFIPDFFIRGILVMSKILVIRIKTNEGAIKRFTYFLRPLSFLIKCTSNIITGPEQATVQ